MFEKLEANHTYAAYLLIGQNLEANLIGDPCQIMTLKHKLVFDTDEKISVTINRQKGAFEVYRPKVEDVDGGLVKYIFEAIDETGTVVRTVEAAPGGSDVATFYVDGTAIKAGENYKFRVKCLFDDNQKEVEYTIGQESDFLSAPTNTIPAIEWKPSDTGHTGPADIAGNIIIHTGNATLAKPSKDTPIRLHILADGIYESELVLYEETDVTWDTSQVVVRVNQSHLSENTTYRVAVYAWIDGEETQLGYVTFATRKLTTFRAVWGETGDTSHAVSQSLYLKPVDAQGNDLTDQEAITRAEYDMKTVAKIQLTLYRGTGAGKTPIKSIEHNNANGDEYDSSLAAEFFDEQNPIELDEGDFELSSGSLSDSLAYTLEVTAAYDYTVDKLGDGSNLNGYTNEYNVLDRAATVTKTMVPPELPAPDAAHRAVQVKELYNKDAVKYGAVKDENLPDDTVIGYQLTATYDNSYSLAREITYYVYEAYAYKTAEKGNGNMVYQDAMEGGDNAAFSYSQSVSAYTATIPSLIVLFGKGEPSYYDGTRVVYAGEAIYEPANKKLKGMDRGYQYVFAYTVKYSPSGTGSGSINYPFEMEDYKDYAQSGVYALNSGIWKAPRCNPTFYTYPESSNGQILTLNYYYTDGDNTIISEASTNQTKIMIDNQNASAEIGGIGPERTWNQVNLTQTNVPNQNVIFSPWLDYKIYELSYGDMPDVFDPIPRYYMGHFPVEYVDPVVKAAVPQIKVEMETDNIERNELVFRLSAGGLSSGVFQEAVNRIAALKVTFTRTTGGDDNVTLVKYLYVDPNSLAARISTSELDKLVGTAISSKVTYELIYDTGEQGWGLLKEESAKKSGIAEVAIQKLKAEQTTLNGEGVRVFNWGNYVAKNPTANSVIQSQGPANSMFQHDIDRDSVPEDYSKQQFYISVVAPTATGSPWSFGRNYSFSYNGIANGYYNSVTGQPPTEYEVPKQLKTVSLDYSDILTLEQITPSVTLLSSSLNVGAEDVRVNTFTINGFEPFFNEGYKEPKIRLDIYKTEKGSAVGEPVVTSDPIPVKKGQNTYGNIELVGLEKDTDYCIIVKYQRSDGEEWIPLMSGTNPTETNYLAFTTKSSVKVTIEQDNYAIVNNGYFDKRLVFDYQISQVYNIRIEYELWDGGGTTMLADADKLDELGMIKKYPENQAYNGYMQADMVIGNGTLMVPGQNYRIYIKVYAAGTDRLLSADNCYFVVNRSTNVKPSVYFEAISSTSRLDFYATVSDSGNTLMGRKFGLSDSTTGIYKVRFHKVTETGLEPITSPYDEKLFYTGDNRQVFSLTGLEPEQKYQMTVYAVVDANEDGKNDNGPAGELETHGWDYYYEGDTATDGSSAECEITQFNEYALGSRIQSTLDEKGIYLGNYYLTSQPGQTNKLRLMLSEASGLDKITELTYSLSGSNGQSETKTVKRSDMTTGNIFTEVKSGNYCYYDFPFTLKDGNANYQLVVEFTVNGESYAKDTFVYNKIQ